MSPSPGVVHRGPRGSMNLDLGTHRGPPSTPGPRRPRARSTSSANCNCKTCFRGAHACPTCCQSCVIPKALSPVWFNVVNNTRSAQTSDGPGPCNSKSQPRTGHVRHDPGTCQPLLQPVDWYHHCFENVTLSRHPTPCPPAERKL